MGITHLWEKDFLKMLGKLPNHVEKGRKRFLSHKQKSVPDGLKN